MQQFTTGFPIVDRLAEPREYPIMKYFGHLQLPREYADATSPLRQLLARTPARMEAAANPHGCSLRRNALDQAVRGGLVARGWQIACKPRPQLVHPAFRFAA